MQYAEDIKHKTTLLELQKMFTYLMVSSTFKPPAAPINVSRLYFFYQDLNERMSLIISIM